MSEYRNPTNPNAFPQGYEAYLEDTKGMTLRDYFAAKAMEAMINGFFTSPSTSIIPDDVLSERAYDYADAMLKQREI